MYTVYIVMNIIPFVFRKHTASTHGDHNIYITETKSGKWVQTLTGHPRTPWCIAYHPSSPNLLASGCLGGEVRVWDMSVSCYTLTVEN